MEKKEISVDYTSPEISTVEINSSGNILNGSLDFNLPDDPTDDIA